MADSIVRFHTIFRANGTARVALPLVLEGLRRRGLTPVSVSTLVANGDKPARDG